MSAYQFDCDFCDETVRTTAVKTLRAQAKEHLEADHYADVLSVIGESRSNTACLNDCGDVFPMDGADVSGLDCPECGYDNLSPLVERYVYWRLEER